ncbi:MAG: hypothetical protein OXT07_13905, partial [bacterium]|nr:hypothetical protein [bacterium]
MPEINIPPEGVTCPAGYQYGSGSLGSSPPYAAPSGKFWNSVKASVPVFPAHTCWQFRSGGCPAGTIMAMARYSTTPNRLLTGYEEGHLPEAPDGKKWTHTVANADYACYRLVEKPTAPSPFDYVIGVLRETGRTTMTATARLGVAAESFIRSLGRGTEYFISGLGRVTYSVVCNFIGGAFVTEEAGRTAAQRLAVRVARDVAVAVRAVTTATTGLALYAACIAFPIDSDNSD